MKYFFDQSDQIAKEMQGRKIIAFFDFDLTLSPLATIPTEAFLPPPVKALLTELSHHVPVSIISGRDLSDLEARVRLPELQYAGNHGMEWHIKGKKHVVDFKPEPLAAVLQQLQILAKRFPGSFFEKKNFAAILHYRQLQKADEVALVKELKKIQTENIKLRWSKKAFEVAPLVDWDKGSVCLAIIRALHAESWLPLYIGDDLTDEDAFRELSNGITIRIGNESDSGAKFYVKSQEEIIEVLRWLIKQVESAHMEKRSSEEQSQP